MRTKTLEECRQAMRPCPFCGERGEIQPNPRIGGKGKFIGGCMRDEDECGVGPWFGSCATPQEVLDTWNHRA